jgi:hypothetical protein
LGTDQYLLTQSLPKILYLHTDEGHLDLLALLCIKDHFSGDEFCLPLELGWSRGNLQYIQGQSSKFHLILIIFSSLIHLQQERDEAKAKLVRQLREWIDLLANLEEVASHHLTSCIGDHKERK